MTAGVLGAVIAACAAVLAAAGTQFAVARRAEADRVYERRRTALLDVQDAALQLRDELRTYGRRLAQATRESRPADTVVRTPRDQILSIDPDSDGVDRARGRLDVTGVRLDGSAAADSAPVLLSAWRTAADEHFISPSDEAAGAEQQAWDSFHLAVAGALQK